MKRTYYIGLDLHKESIAIAYAVGGSRHAPVYVGECGGSNLSIERALRKLAGNLGVRLRELKVCYEAGPTGFVLARRLRTLKIETAVMSPSKREHARQGRIKTDRRDAKAITRLFRNGDITEMRAPSVLEEYLQAIDSAVEGVERLVAKMKELLSQWERKLVVRAVMACRGFQEVAATTLVGRRTGQPAPLRTFPQAHGVPGPACHRFADVDRLVPWYEPGRVD